MFQNIFVGILTIFAVAAAVFGWWLENGGSGADKNEHSKEDKE